MSRKQAKKSQKTATDSTEDGGSVTRDVARDEPFMQQAFRLARRALGQTSPNPLVGAVVVVGDRVVGEGYHRCAGEPHAEQVALERAGSAAKGADLYVNLEPCNHQGRTAPCCKAITQAGIRRVVVGMIDPNPLVNGRGVRALRRAGVEVVTGVLKDEATALNAPFVTYITKQRPRVTLKAAVTLDGAAATRDGDSRWVTSAESRRHGHKLRKIHDGILVGVRTVLADNPLLTCREVKGDDPVRIVLDSRLRTPATAAVVQAVASSRAATWIVTTDAASEKRAQRLRNAGAEVIRVPQEMGRVSIRGLVQVLYERGLLTLLVEGGPTVAGSFWQAHAVDQLTLFYAPKILGDGKALAWLQGLRVPKMAQAHAVQNMAVQRMGPDLMVTGDVIW